MNLRNCIIIILLWFSFSSIKSQRANYWYFGANAGLNFNTTPPTILTNGQTNIPDNTSAISDGSGNLLFYTDGVTVWNKLNTIMPNGTGLIGNLTAGQCALIMPIPCDAYRYVIFHVTEFSNPGWLHYTVVDLSLNGGLGDVVVTQKNVSLGSGWTEKLCAYYNSAGGNYWLLTHKWNSDQFVAFDVNSSTIATNSVTSSIGSIHNCGTYGAAHDAMGQLTISKDGTKVLNALTCQDKFELFNFNSATGVLSNSISIPGTGGSAWGTAFSNNNTKIYLNTILGATIFQYDISSYNQTTIVASQYAVVTVTTSGYNFGYMETGPDGKLYIGKPSLNYLSVVNNPDNLGSACNFSLVGQSLGSKTSNHGLCRVAYNIPTTVNNGTFIITGNPSATLCPTGTITLIAGPILSSSTYTWAGPGIVGSVNSQSILVNSAGIYTCSMPGCGNSIASMTFAVYNSGSVSGLATIPSTLNLCPGISPTLVAVGAITYTWQPGSIIGATITPAIPNVNTVYTVTGTDLLGCQASRTVGVLLYPSPTIAIAPFSPTICQGSYITFSLSGAPLFSVAPWGFYSGLTTQFQVSPPATTGFTAIGYGAGGCTSSIMGTITVNPTPNVTINPATYSLCGNSAASFTAGGAFSYTWYPGAITNSVLNLQAPVTSGVYTLIAVSAQGCTAQVIKSFTVIPSPTISASSNPTSTCAGGSVTLTANGATNYTWFPGNIAGQAVTVNPLSTTIYSVAGESNGCVSTASALVANLLSPTITSSGNITCNNINSQIFISANSNTYTILWSGPGISGIVSSSVITTTGAGIYSAVLTDTVTNCSATSTIQILNTIANLSITIIPSYTLACYPGPPLNLLVSTSANYTWFPSFLVTPSVGPLVTVNPQVTTTYTVLATLGVCSGSSAITISVNPTPTITAALNSLTVCSGKTTTLSASGASEYNWMPGNIPGASIIIEPLAATVYSVIGTSNTCASLNTITVSILPTPVISASVFPALMCVGDLATLTATGTGTINWTTGVSIVPGSTFVTSPFTNTTYTAIATNSLGCYSSYPVMVSVRAGPALFANSSSSLICSYETTSLTAGGSGVNYIWLPTKQTGNSIIATPSVSTVYTVVAENTGCKSYTTVAVNVQECVQSIFGMTNAADEPSINNNLYQVNFTVTVVNNSSQTLGNVILHDDLKTTFSYPCTYTVIQSPIILSSRSALKINSLYDGYSQLSLTDSSASSLGAGKRDTLLVSVLVDPHDFSGVLKNSVIGFAQFPNTVSVSDSSNNGFNWDPDNDGDPTNNNEATPIELELIELFIPQGFSPDGDGKYDYFVIKGLNGRHVNITIFNRWGNKVYVKNNYDNTWDGRPNVGGLILGKGQLPEATYYYIVEFQDGKKEVKTGFVVLKYE